MKKFSLLIAGVLLSLANLFSQGCLPEGITFTTQQQVDDFQINYPDCTHLLGDMIVSGTNINNLNGLNGLTAIEGSVYLGNSDLGGNLTLVNISGLGNVASIKGNFMIFDNRSLINLSSLGALTSVGGSLMIVSNQYLTSLNGLENLAHVGGDLEIWGDESLTNIDGLAGLISIEGSLNITLLHDLTNITGLYNLTSIGNNLNISGNHSLTSLEGLSAVASIGGAISIQSNDNIHNLVGLPVIHKINKHLSIESNYTLSSLEGLENLNVIDDYLSLAYNSLLPGLAGLEGLTSIAGVMIINGNYSLTSLSKLESLVTVDGIFINSNETLTSLTGIQNIDANSVSEISIVLNNSLSNCAVQSICNYLASPNSTVEIHDNAPGCNSQEEVEEDCLTIGLVEGSTQEYQLNIFPNPTPDNMTIEMSSLPSNSQLSIFNTNGVQLVNKKITELSTLIDLCSFTRGIYFLKLINDNTIKVYKIVKN